MAQYTSDSWGKVGHRPPRDPLFDRPVEWITSPIPTVPVRFASIPDTLGGLLMYRRPHDERDGMKVWLSESEVDQLLEHVEDTTHRIALGLAFRCGLRSAEIVQVAPTDVVDGPAGTMLRVREEGAKGDQYRETPIPPDLTTTVQVAADVRQEPTDAPLVDASTRTVRRWVKRYAEELAEETGDEGWRDLSAHDARRSWATLLAGAGVDPLLVCDWGGWSDLQTFLEAYKGHYSPEVQRRARDGVDWL